MRRGGILRAVAPGGRAGLSDVLLLACLLFLGIFLVVPLIALARQSFFDGATFTGLACISRFLATPNLTAAFLHTCIMGIAVTAITLVMAFLLAYGVTHTRFAGRRLCQGAAYLPLFVPSLFPALGLLYLCGSQGLLTSLFGDIPLYGPLGIILGSIIYTLPHAFLPLVTALADVDEDLYTAARTLGAGPWRRFVTVTLPAARYGLVSSAIVVFVLTITDFGVPKVLGGDYAMLATEIFKQIVGMQDFSMGATVSFALLLPCIPAFILDAYIRRKQRFSLRGRRLRPLPLPRRDITFTLLAWLTAAFPLAVIGMAVWGSFIAFWPYELSFTLDNYSFDSSVYGASPFGNSLLMAALTAIGGTGCIFGGAYLLTRCRTAALTGGLYRFLALLPLAVPGTVLGLAYILAFNAPTSPLQALYGTLPFLACNCIIHFYTVCHFTAVGGLTRLHPDYETVGATLGASRLRTVTRVIIPMQKNVLADMAFYLFVNALTTISAVIFLYSPDTVPASVAILQMLDSGAIAQASAMGALLLAAALAVRFCRSLLQD